MKLSTQFVSATKEYCSLFDMVPAPYIRKSFQLDMIPDNAELSICGLGFYELFINGKRITKGYFAPYISNPDDVMYYDTYQLKDHLQVGENVLGIMLGNGMQNAFGGEIWNFDKARWRSAPKVALNLEIRLRNGENFVITADESFKTAPSPIYLDDLRIGEFYDARKEILGWNLPGFDDSSWNNVFISETPRGEARLCTVEPIVATREVTPISIKKSKISIYPKFRSEIAVIDPPEDEAATEGWLYDFGINSAGLCRLKVKGEAGQKIILQFGELLAEDGGLDLRGMTFLPKLFIHRDIYICKGGEEEIYMPTFTYHGFQYCLVIGLKEEQATSDLLTYVIMNSDLSDRGGFSCSDEITNRLWELTQVSNLSNFYYIPTDCPQREKNGWTGDAALSAEQMLISLSVEKSLKEWLFSIRKSQNEKGAIPGIVPTSGWGFDWGNGPGWDAALIYLPYYIWLYRDDKQVLEENATAIFRYLHYISLRRDAKGLLHIGLGDWCQAARTITPTSPLEVTDTLISMDICKKASKIYEVLGMKLQETFAKQLYSELRTSARKYLVNLNTFVAYGNCQTSQAMAIYYDVFEPSEKQGAFQVLLQLIEEKDGSIDVGILGAKVLFQVLSDFGRTDLAYRMITKKEFPSYGYWIEQGATSLWENFNLPEVTPDSKNHHFFGHISAWFMQNLVGIKVNPFETNSSEVRIEPQFITQLNHAEGYHILPAGKISCSWKRKENIIELEIKLPVGCYGDIVLPSGWRFEDGFRIKPLTNGLFQLIKA